MSATIGGARPEELPGVLRLLEEAHLPGAGVAEHFGNFLTARRGDAVVGAVGLECYGDVGLLRSLVVEPGERGAGLGIRLTEAVLALARARRLSRVYLLTLTAERFFPRFGFELVERRELDPQLSASQELQGGCCQTAVCMRLALPGGEATRGPGDPAAP